jgi:hypothetical protein
MTENLNLMAAVGFGSTQAVMQRAANPYFAKAISRTPEYDEAKALREKAIAARLRLVTSRPHAPAMPTSAADDLDSWLAAAAQAAAADAEWVAKDAAIVNLIAAADARIRGVAFDRDAILKSLDQDLQTLMSDIADAVERLGGATTPSEVIAAGTGDAWNELGQLRAQYDCIREAQASAILGADEQFNRGRSNYLRDDALANDAAVANLDSVFEHWRDPDRSFVSLGPERRPQPWPEDPIGELVWMSTSGAQPWVPTLRQLEALWTRRRATANPAPKVIHGRPDQPQPSWQPINLDDDDSERTHA